jgi:hypothetical protein
VSLVHSPPPPSERGLSLGGEPPSSAAQGAFARWLNGPTLSTPLVAALLLGVAAYFTALNADLPIVRNALLNAQIAERLWAHDLRLWTVCSDPALVFNKPCGFGTLAAPWVAALGINRGIVWTSFLGGVLFLASSWHFLRHFNSRYGLTDRALPLELGLCFLNPLLVDQFWSGYSDALYSAGFLFSFVVLDRLVRRPAPPGSALALFGAFVFSSLMKHGTVVLIPLQLAYLAWHARELRELWRTRRVQVLALGAALLGSALFLLLGRLGYNPLLNLMSNKNQLQGEVNYAMNVKEVGVFLLITLGTWLCLLPFVRVRRAEAALLTVAALNAALLTLYKGSTYNARYYIALLPFLAPLLVRAYLAITSRRLRSLGLASFLVLHVSAIAVFNQRTLYRSMTAALPGFNFGATGYLDSLRMGDHLEALDSLDSVNRELPFHGKLFYISSYYGQGGVGVFEAAGFFRPDLRIAYVENSAEARALAAPGDHAYYPPPFDPEPDAAMTRLDNRLYIIR